MKRAAVVLLVLLAGCGGDGGAGGKGTITFQVAGSPDEFKLYRVVITRYERSTGVRVQLVEVADEESFGTKLATSIAAGRPPDVALISYRGFKKYAELGQFVPVGPRLTGGLSLDDYFPKPLEAFTHDGEIQCLPQNLSSLVVYYNRELFEKAGLEAPAAEWTYDELMAAAEAIDGLDTPEGRASGVAIDRELIRVAPFVWSAGGELVDDQADPTRFTLDTHESRRGLEHFLALAKHAPSPREAKSQDDDSRFLDGRLGMVLSSRRKVPAYREASFEWDVAPFPRDREQVSVLHTDGFCVMKGADEEAALDFVQFAAGPEGQRTLAELGRIVPAVRAVAESSDFLDSMPPESNEVFLDQAEVLRILPTVPESPALEERVALALEQAWVGRISVDALIERIERETAPIFRR